MPTAEGEWEGEFNVDFGHMSDMAKFWLIEAVIKGDKFEIEGSADVSVDFEMGDYAPDR